MKKYLLVLLILVSVQFEAQNKREFRGAWIQIVNGQFQGLGTENTIYFIVTIKRTPT